MARSSKQAGDAPTAFIFTFPFWFWADRTVIGDVYDAPVPAGRVRVYGPVRMADANFIPGPSVRPDRVPFLAGAKPDLHRLRGPVAALYPMLGGEPVNRSALLALEPDFRGIPDPFPADAIRIDAYVDSGGFDHDGFISRVLEWIRYLTRQWWVGCPQDGLVGFKRVSFSINDLGEPIDAAHGHGKVTAVSGGERSLSLDLWRQAVREAANGEGAPVVELLLLDARYHGHAGYLRRAVLDAAIACEEALVRAARRIWTNKTPDVPFKKGRVLPSEDLRDRLHGDLKRLVGRSLADERPDLHGLLGDLWLSRHSSAHGGRLLGIRGGKSMPLSRNDCKEFVDAAFECVRWLDEVVPQ